MQRKSLQLLFPAMRRMFTTSQKLPVQQIRKHTPKTEYPGFKPLVHEHTDNRVRVYEDPNTHLRFLIEQSGFPGCTDLGICIKLGTRDEDAKTAGSLHYLKNYVHIKETLDEIVKYQYVFEQLQRLLSAIRLVFQPRVRPFVHIHQVLVLPGRCGSDAEFVIRSRSQGEENVLGTSWVKQENSKMESEVKDIVELTRRTAFGHQGLGMPKSGIGNQLTNADFLKFQKRITPANTLFSFSNYPDENQLIKLINEKITTKYPQFLRRPTLPRLPSKYKGGLQSYVSPTSEFFEFAIAYESCPLHSEHMEMMNIIRTVLGNASSFSSGGPGKGMHSRCTKNLLNSVACVEKASFINEHYSDSGIFGLTVGGPQDLAKQVVQCTLNEFKKLLTPISQEELQRAKNILVAGIYANIERQADRLQQMSKHIFSYGRVRLMEYEQKIRKVRPQQITDFMKNMVKSEPTLVSLSAQPVGDRIKQWTANNMP